MNDMNSKINFVGIFSCILSEITLFAGIQKHLTHLPI